MKLGDMWGLSEFCNWAIHSIAMTGYLTFPKKAVGPGIPIKSHAQI